MKKTKNSKIARSPWILAIIGIVLAFFLVFTFILIWAKFVDAKNITNKNCTAIIFLIQFVSALLGLLIPGILAQENKIRITILTAVSIALLQLCFVLILYDGFDVRFFTNLISIAIAALVSIFVINKRKQKSNTKRRGKR